MLITGHSLGGAMAEAFIPILIHQVPEYLNSEKLKALRDRVEIYTMGAYKPGFQNFRNLLNFLVPNCFRIVNHSDPIVRYPPGQ